MQIMPLGDSITFGINYPGGYRINLEALLAQKDIVVNFLGSQENGPASLKSKHNEGHPGWSIQHLAQNTPAWLDIYKPEIILLMIGTNDLWVDEASQKPDVDAALNQLKILVSTIVQKMPTSKIVIASVPPSPFFWNQYVIEYNSGIKEFVSTEAKSNNNLQFADVYGAMSVNDLDQNDGMGGVHPSSQGYNKIAATFFAALMSR